MSELGDAIILDADQNTILTEHRDLEKFPNDVVNSWSTLSVMGSCIVLFCSFHVYKKTTS